MAQRDLHSLIELLSPECRRAFEAGARSAAARRHALLTVAHLLAAALDDPDSEVTALLDALGLVDTVRAELVARRDATEALPGSENDTVPTPSLDLVQLLQSAWFVRGLAGRQTISSGVVLAALTDVEAQRRVARLSAPTLLTIPRGGILKRIGGETPPGEAQPEVAKDDPLTRYTHDLTAAAAAGDIDPIVGRDAEIRRVIDVLARRRQNNPMLVGDAGVGKTAIAEGLALRLAGGDVPPSLSGVRLLALDLGALRAGASMQGEFEERLRGVLQAVAEAPSPVVLFIDEAHSLIGAGGRVGTGDAANLLKPALARGDLRTVGATTWGEYKRHVERDAALARRFQVVAVDEPAPAVAETMLRALAERLSTHHGVQLVDEAVVAAVRLSHRYVSGRRLPDKAVSVLDTACARVAVAQASTPEPLERVQRHIERYEQEIALLESEGGGRHDDRLAGLYGRLDGATERRIQLIQRWEREQALVERILAIAGQGATARRVRSELEAELTALQGDEPLVPIRVDAHAVARVVSDWTGVPPSRMVVNPGEAMLDLGRALGERVIGQTDAVDSVARRLVTASARMESPDQPVGVFLLVGPTGTGKTLLAETLAQQLFGGDRGLLTINLSEYQEAHSVAGLKGAPPGYVGYGEGGLLTEAIRRRPYTLVLLDEVEKAHRDVLELFFPVFDRGTLDDAEGIRVDFRNTVIVLTTQVGAEQIARHPGASADELRTVLRPLLESRFPRALLSRLTVVPLRPLAEDSLRAIADMTLREVCARTETSWNAVVERRGPLHHDVAAHCVGAPDGARAVRGLVSDRLVPVIARLLLAGQGGEPPRVLIESVDRARFQVTVGDRTAVGYWVDTTRHDDTDGGSEAAGRRARRGAPGQPWGARRASIDGPKARIALPPVAALPSVVLCRVSTRSVLPSPRGASAPGIHRWRDRLGQFIQSLAFRLPGRSAAAFV